MRKENSRQHTVRYVALYEPKAKGGRGAVAKFAEVLSIEETVRSAIKTSWGSTVRENDILLYRLSKFQTLETPILNRRSERLSEERWTTRLALRRVNESKSTTTVNINGCVEDSK